MRYLAATFATMLTIMLVPPAAADVTIAYCDTMPLVGTPGDATIVWIDNVPVNLFVGLVPPTGVHTSPGSWESQCCARQGYPPNCFAEV